MVKDRFLNKSEYFIKLAYIIISILSMSSLIYSKISLVYKVATILVVILSCFFIYKKRYYSDEIIITTSFLIGANLLSAIVNIKANFIGNILEILFMTSYIYIMMMGNSKIIKEIFKTVSYLVQIISFVVAIFGIGLVAARYNIVFSVGETSYNYGIENGRFWGVINPNAAAMFCYISIILAILLIISGSEYSRLLKVNILIQSIYFLLQQSRGALISVILMVIIYFIFIYTGEFKKKVLLSIVCSVSIFTLSVVENYGISLYTSGIEMRVIDLNNNQVESSNKKEKDFENRTFETGSSGRLPIWKGAVKMGMENPIFGIGNRNIAGKYEDYFDKYEISNSLKGGNFHNIFITAFVSTGIIGLLAFCYFLFCIGKRFLLHIINGNNLYSRILVLPFFGILIGQLFESTILYSTNFINIFFWMLIGYGLIKIEESKLEKYTEITSIEELQDMELKILEYVHNVCEKQGYRYYLAYGTLIGAIRHKGFIPWDDDIDIVMPRDDYEKLQSYLLKNKDENFEVMTYLNNKNYVYPFMKVIDKRTYLVEEDVRLEQNMGVYIDIFPLDGHEKDKEFRNKMTKLIKKRQLSCYTFKGIVNKNSLINTLIRYICIFLFYFSSTNKYIKKIDELAKSRKISESKYIDYIVLKDIKSPNIKREWYNESIDVEFNGKLFKVPKNYHEILTADYGDYMQLPPEEQRVTHHSFKAWKIIE